LSAYNSLIHNKLSDDGVSRLRLVAGADWPCLHLGNVRWADRE